jgi:hypothetical protein
MTGWIVNLAPREETRSLLVSGWHPATLVTVALFFLGLAVGVAGLFLR